MLCYSLYLWVPQELHALTGGALGRQTGRWWGYSWKRRVTGSTAYSRVSSSLAPPPLCSLAVMTRTTFLHQALPPCCWPCKDRIFWNMTKINLSYLLVLGIESQWKWQRHEKKPWHFLWLSMADTAIKEMEQDMGLWKMKLSAHFSSMPFSIYTS